MANSFVLSTFANEMSKDLYIICGCNGHNIPEPIIRRRYASGIKNLFNLFMSEVDYWDIYDNSKYPRKQIACGGKNTETKIIEEKSFNLIKNYVK